MSRKSIAAILFALAAWPSGLVAAPAMTSMAQADAPLTVPKSGTIKVAFVISDGFTLIDIAGPMQTFNQVQLPDGTFPFEVFTVSATRAPIKSWHALTVTPDYTFDDAPDADIVVVGAQKGDDERYLGYLRRMNASGKLMLSVCTGASKFAKAGLLDGLDAATHHSFVDQFQKEFPKVHFLRDKAYVHSAPMIYTGGGETSGFELALHIVELYYGRAMAVDVARSMEYRGPDWQK